MSEAEKHTPGPWVLEKPCKYRVGGTSSAWFALNAPREDTFVAMLPTGCGEYRANARLIAASPDMLDALRRIIRCHDEGCDEQLDKLIDIGRAAVAKATGAVPVSP